MNIKIPTYCCPNAIVYMTCSVCGARICNQCLHKTDQPDKYLCEACHHQASVGKSPKQPIKRVS
jgi:hypothetical protein